MHVVVNWLWQGGALTAVAAVSMRTAPRLSATTRYLVWWTTLILVLLLPALPWLVALAGAPPTPANAVVAIAPVPLPELPAWPLTIGLACWATWIAVAAVRIGLSFAALLRARRLATPFPAAREARLTHWSSVRGTGRRARLVCSDCVASAAVLGFGDAVIAVSPGAARRLTDQELDQVLLHEWAHVQRRDDFARLAQIAIRVVAGLHPAVWWIDRRLEIEREIACDDYAVNITGGARSLALCLTKLAEVPHTVVNATLAPGAIATSQLTLRVLRLLDPRRNTSTARARAWLGSVAGALAILAVVLSHVELVVAASSLVRPVAPAVGGMEPPVSPAQRLVPSSDPNLRARDQMAAPRAVEPAVSPSAQPDERSAAPTLPAVSEAGAIRPGTAPVTPTAAGAWVLPELPSASGAAQWIASAPAAGVPVVEAPPEHQPVTPWGAAADAGVSVGRGSQKAAQATADAGTSVGRSSQKAAVATAGFFSRMGRTIAGGF